MTVSEDFEVVDRYFSIVVFNNTADNLRNNTGANTITVTPVPPEAQD
jgi:hypothetical protein